MSLTLEILVWGAALISIGLAAPKAQEKNQPQLSCQEFSRGAVFNDNQAIGTWYVRLYKTENSQGIHTEAHCIQYMPINEKERRKLKDDVGKYVKDLKWPKVVLKMQIPCISSANRTRNYYLEKLEGEGSYRTLQMPYDLTDKLDASSFERYPMRLKQVADEYIGMMDCHENLVFLLSHDPPGKELEEKIRKMFEFSTSTS